LIILETKAANTDFTGKVQQFKKEFQQNSE